MKKILSIILSLCMLVSLCTGLTTVPAFGQDPEFEEATDSETGSGGNPDEPGSGDNVSAGDFEEIHWPNDSYEKQTDADALFDDDKDTYISVPAGKWLTFEFAEDFATAFSGMRFFESTAGTNGLATATVQVSDDGAYYYDVTAEVSQEDSFAYVLFTDGETPYSVNAKFVRIKSSAAWDISGISLINEKEGAASLPADITAAVKEADTTGVYGLDYMVPYGSYVGSVGTNTFSEGGTGSVSDPSKKWTIFERVLTNTTQSSIGWATESGVYDGKPRSAKTFNFEFTGAIPVGGVRIYPVSGQDRQWLPKNVTLIGLVRNDSGELVESTYGIATLVQDANPVEAGTYYEVFFADAEGEVLDGLKILFTGKIDGDSTIVRLSRVQVLKPVAEDDRPDGKTYVASNLSDNEMLNKEVESTEFGTSVPNFTTNGHVTAYSRLHDRVIKAATSSAYYHVEVSPPVKEGGTSWYTIKYNEPVTFSGVSVYSRIDENGNTYNGGVGQQTLTKGKIWVSDTGEEGSWVSADEFVGAASNLRQDLRTIFGGTLANVTASYVRVEVTEVCGGGGSTWAVSEMSLIKPDGDAVNITTEDLANFPGITNEGTITIDKTEDPISVEEIELKNDTEIASVEILNGEEVIATLDSDDYTVSDNTLTFSDEFAGSLRAGAYTVKITFADAFDTVAEIGLTVKYERPIVLIDVTAEDFEEIYWTNTSYEKQTNAEVLFDEDNATVISVPEGMDITFGLSEDFEDAFYGMRFFKNSDGTNYLNTAKAWVSEDGAYFYEVTPEISNDDEFTDLLFTDGAIPYKVDVKYVKIRVSDASATTWDISKISYLEAPENDNEFAALPEDIAVAVLGSVSGKYGYEHLDHSSSYIGSVGSTGGWNARYNKYTALKKLVEQPDGTGADYWTVDTTMVDQTEARTITLMFNGPLKVGGIELYPRKADWQWAPKQVGLIGLYEDADGNIREKTEIVTKTLASSSLSSAYETLPLYFSNEEGEELVGVKVVIAKTCANAETYDAAQLMMLTGVGILMPKAEDDREGNYYVAKPFNDSEVYRVAPSKVTFGTTATQTDPGAGISLRLFDHLKVNQVNAGDSYDGAAYVEMPNALNGGSTWFEFDLGAEVTLSGVNVYARISDIGDKAYNDSAIGVQNITKGNLYISDDGETWYLAGTFAGDKANICQAMKANFGGTEFNFTARYIKVECLEVFNGGEKNWSLTEIGLAKPNSENETITAEDLANFPGITTEGTITIDKTGDPISIDEIELKNNTAISSVKILSGEDVVETLDSEDYTVTGTTLTISSELAETLAIGEYTIRITFAYELEIYAEIGLTVMDEKAISLLLVSREMVSDSPVQQSTIVLKNLSGTEETPTVTIGETVIPVASVSLDEIVINRADLVLAYDIYAGMDLINNNITVTAAYEDGTTINYTLIVTTAWFTSGDKTVPNWETGKIYTNAVFAADEVDAASYENFRVRSDSTVSHKRWNAINAFLVDVPQGVTDAYTYHSQTGSPRNYIDVDFGEVVEIGGLRYFPRLTGSGYQAVLKKIVIKGSNDMETWYEVYEGAATEKQEKIDLIFEQKATYRYYRIYMEGTDKFVAAAGFHFLKPETRVIGSVQYDVASESDAEVKFVTEPADIEVTGVKLGETMLDEADYTVANRTITINKECFADVETDIALTIYFDDESELETIVEIIDSTKFEFEFSSMQGAAVVRTENITLKNIKGLSVTKVVLKEDGTVIPFTADEETITITRAQFRQAFDVYKAMDLETGKHQLLVKFSDDSYLTYTVNLSGFWAKKANAVDTLATFETDEIDIITEYPDFAVRTDSVWQNSREYHPVNAFFRSTLAELTGGYRYHGETNEGNNHYLDIDFGAVASLGGLRYYARYENERYQPNWSKVEIYGSNDFETWEKLYDGSATGSVRTQDLQFTKNAEVRYLRIYISNTQYATAASIRFLTPSLRIYNEYGGVMTTVALNKADANEEVTVYTDLPVTGVKVGGATVSAANFEFDEETMALTIKKGALTAIKAAGVSTTIEVLSDGLSAKLNVVFGEKLFSEEVLPYAFANTIKYVSGYSNGGGAANLIDRGVVRRKADGKVMTNSDDDKKLKASGFTVESTASEIYSDSTTGAYPVIEIDYQIPHTFSGVRVYHRVWESGGNRQFGQTMRRAYLQVSNDGINWLTSDTWQATLDGGSNKNSYDDIKFMIKGEEVNVEARYLRLCIVPSGSVTSLMEICLYQPGAGRSLNPAEISFDGERALFSEADPKDMSFDVVYNDAVALTGIKVVAEGEEITAVDPSYINTQGETIVVTKDFFLDNGSAVLPEEFDFVMSFVMGSDVIVPAGYVEEEIHTVTFEAQDANVTISAKRVNKENGEVIAEVSESPMSAKRHEDTVIVATVENGYEAVWEIEENIQTTYTEKPLLFDDNWTLTTTGFRVSGRDYGIHRAFDNNNLTEVWSDTAGHGGSFDSVNNDLDITALFGRRVTLSSMSWQHRIHTTSPNAFASAQGVREYKLYAIVGGVTAETPFKTGTLAGNETLQAITFDPIEVDGLYIWMKKGNSNFSVADINLVERVADEKNVAVKGEVIRKGSKTEEFKITDLYSDAIVKVSTVPVAAGNVKVTTDLVGLTSDAPATATKGEILEVTLTPHEGEELPAEITEITQDGHVLVRNQDFSYVITTPEEEVSLEGISLQSEGSQIGVITIWNARGDIHIVADAQGVIRCKVAFTDEYGAKGDLPQTKFYMEGEEITIPESKLTLSGYTFKGWVKADEVDEDGKPIDGATIYKNGSAETGTFRVLESDVTFVAVWEVKTQGGQPQRPQGGGDAGADDDDDNESFGGGGFGGASDKFQVVISGIGTQAVSRGTVLTAPAVEAGYEFIGWYLDAAYTVPYANNGVTENITLYPYIRRIRSATDLADIQNHWAKEAISKMYVDYIVNGKSDTAFDPDSDITRAEFCQILYKISGQTSDGSEQFTDVNVGDWFANAVAWAVNQGITMGTSEDTFSPYAKITREQMATMIYRYATKVGAQWEISGEAGFADQTEISTYANYQVNWAADKGVISGYPDGTFGPKKEATRAEAVVMLTRLINLLG